MSALLWEPCAFIYFNSILAFVTHYCHPEVLFTVVVLSPFRPRVAFVEPAHLQLVTVEQKGFYCCCVSSTRQQNKTRQQLIPCLKFLHLPAPPTGTGALNGEFVSFDVSWPSLPSFLSIPFSFSPSAALPDSADVFPRRPRLSFAPENLFGSSNCVSTDPTPTPSPTSLKRHPVAPVLSCNQ